MRYEIGQANRLGNREINQDRFEAIETDEAVLLVLADGMGGRPGGELAAQVVVDTARKHFLNSHRPLRDVDGFLRNVIRTIHEGIKDLEVTEGLPASPGSTGVLCVLQDGQAQWAHIGDSRLYLFRNGVALYRTTDHSYVEQLYQKGKIDRGDLASHPQRSYITQCLGAMPQLPVPEISKPTALERDDVILLCSDGLWGAVDDAQLGALLTEGDLDDVLNHMAGQAEQASYPSSDNVSAIALRFIESGGTMPTTASPDNAARNKPEDALLTAIEQIEQAIREYGGEMNPDKKS